MDIKKDRKVWTVDGAIKTMSCKLIGLAVNLTELTIKAKEFLMLYGLKQYLSDCVAGMGGKEYSNKERVAKMLSKFAPLCKDTCSMMITEAGTFHWKDPDRVITRASKLEKALEMLDEKADAVQKALIEAGMPNEFIVSQLDNLTADGMGRDELVTAIEEANKPKEVEEDEKKEEPPVTILRKAE